MGYYLAKILADSISPDGIRLTTFEVTFPRFILAEVNTHRVLSRNSASSRAIPPEKTIQRVLDDPFIPEFCNRQKGMEANEKVDAETQRRGETAWRSSLKHAVNSAQMLINLNVDKARVNRILEPYMWHTAIISATEWDNFFNLRTSKDAQPEFREIALRMKNIYDLVQPRPLDYGAWHLPLVGINKKDRQVFAELDNWDTAKKVSVGRCARVSYLTHDGKRDLDEDIKLHDRLLESGHLSPFEHIATPIHQYLRGQEIKWSGNFRGWHQYRKDIPNEANFKGGV